MTSIVLDDEQTRIVASATGRVELRDRSGRVIGYLEQQAADHGFTEEDIAIALQRLRSNQPRHTTEEVLAYLASLERK